MVFGSGLMTAEELLRLPSGTWRYELVRGELRRMSPAGHGHGKVVMRFANRLGPYVEAHHLGECYAAETGFVIRRHPDTVRAPDCAFVSAATLSTVWLSRLGFFPGAPDLAVEVVSPFDTPTEVEDKVADWLGAGCQAVVVVDPRREVAMLHRPGVDVEVLAKADRLTLPGLLPGWSLALEEIFR